MTKAIRTRTPPIDPTQDGIDHINVWSKAATPLGKWLSNFYLSPFEHPRYGRFSSMEAFWYWIATGRSHDELRNLWGFSAKAQGSKLERVPMEEGDFQEAIIEGLRCKAATYPEMLKLLSVTELPLRHYFVFNGRVVDQTRKHQWQLDAWREIAKTDHNLYELGDSR